MAIAKNLNVTHSVDNKVTVLIKSGQDVLKATEKVDDKVSVLINGGHYAFSLAIHPFLGLIRLPDVKETKAVIRRTVDVAYHEKRSCSELHCH